jgi:hypothetical protein
MTGAADARHGRGDLPGLSLRKRDQLLHRLGRESGMDPQQWRTAGHLNDGVQIAYRVEPHVAIHAWHDRNRRARAKHGVAIGFGAHDDLRADLSACARAVIHDHLLAPDIGEARGDCASDQIHGSPGGVRIDHAHGPVGKVALRSRIRDRSEHCCKADECDRQQLCVAYQCRRGHYQSPCGNIQRH